MVRSRELGSFRVTSHGKIALSVQTGDKKMGLQPGLWGLSLHRKIAFKPYCRSFPEVPAEQDGNYLK
jgi:hypothetical protein